MAMLDILAAQMRERHIDAELKMAHAECDRLRGLLSIARDGLKIARIGLLRGGRPNGADAADEALRRSDPDASPEDV